MAILGGVAKDAGLAAAQELHRLADGAIPDAQKAVDEIVSRVASEIVTQFTGSLTQAAGALALSAGALPEQIAMALDGFKIEVSPITVNVSRRQSCA